MPELPPAAASLDRTLVEAVDAAAAGDADRLAGALDRLAAADPEHVQRLLAAGLRPALERHHPDGVDGDDLAVLVRDVLAAHPTWPLEAFALAVVLTGAFGITITLPDAATDQVGPEDSEAGDPPVDPATLTWHAVLVLAHLAPRRRDCRALLDDAWSEIARADAEDG